MMLKKRITYCGQPATVGCDGKCNKAWGSDKRPRNYLIDEDTNPDDFEWLADQELGEAPANPGTSEGISIKPTTKEDRLNKWCVRQCERSRMTEIYDPDGDLGLNDFSKRIVPYSDMEPTSLLKEKDWIKNRLNNI